MIRERGWGGGHLHVDGCRLEMRTAGPPPESAPTLFLLHEGLGCAALWRDFPERLARATGFGVCACSRAGYGASDPCALPRPLDYMTREALTVLPEVLAQTGIRRAILLGHSDGASIAAIHAGKVQDPRIRGLVLMAPHFFTEEMGLAAIREARRAWQEGGLRDRLAKYHRNVEAAFLGWNDAWLDPDFRSWDIRAVLDRIRVPVLCLQGVEDQYGSEAQIRVVGERVPGPVRLCMIPECRHAPHLEAPGAVLEEIARFAASLDMGVEAGAGAGGS